MIEEFHELCVRIKTIYKRDALRGYQRRVIDAKTVSQGSSETSVEGRHHYTNIRNVFCFLFLVQYRVEELTNDYNDMDMELKSLFFNLGKKATVENLNLIFSKNEFQNLVS